MARLATIVVGYLCVIVLVAVQPGASGPPVAEPHARIVVPDPVEADCAALPSTSIEAPCVPPTARIATIAEQTTHQHR